MFYEMIFHTHIEVIEDLVNALPINDRVLKVLRLG